VTDTEELPALSIGAVLGGADYESQAWKSAIMALARRVEVAREGVRSDLPINVVYHVEGPIAPNEFDGVRTGRYRSRGGLVVQAAVPSAPVGNRFAVLLDLLEAAVNEADHFAQRRKIPADLIRVREIVADLRREG